MPVPRRWSTPLATLVFLACGGGDADEPGSAAGSATASGAAAVQETEWPERVYWGDTHLHTGNSFDVYLFGTPTSTPETA